MQVTSFVKPGDRHAPSWGPKTDGRHFLAEAKRCQKHAFQVWSWTDCCGEEGPRRTASGARVAVPDDRLPC